MLALRSGGKLAGAVHNLLKMLPLGQISIDVYLPGYLQQQWPHRLSSSAVQLVISPVFSILGLVAVTIAASLRVQPDL